MSAEDVLNHELVYLKKFMFWGWAPLVVEDAASIYCILMVWFSTGQNIIGLSRKYAISVTVSILSVCVSLVLSCRKNKKLRQNEAFQCARICYCCWSGCAGCCVSMMAMMTCFVALFATKPTPFIDISNDGWCEVWDESHSEWRWPLRAELTDAPNMIYNGSELFEHTANYGSYYDIAWYDNWTFTCLEDSRDMILNCEIQWIYLNQTESCEFNIESGFCGDLTIQCENNFTFYDGNPKMFACIDYCSLD